MNIICSTADQTSMESVLFASMEQGGMIVCVKDKDKLVLKQNEGCIKLCGKREGELCNIGCMEIYENDTMQQWKDWGNRTYKNCFLHERYFDVTLLCSNSHLVTILQPLEEKQAIAKEYYRKMGLSKREMEVVAHAIAGLSNTEISEKLHISNATLRTHLNNAYRKIDDAEGTLEHLPTNRIVS